MGSTGQPDPREIASQEGTAPDPTRQWRPRGGDPLIAMQIEEASINAWPAATQLVVDGWLLRLAGGFTKRANSVVPLYPGQRDPGAKVRFCENLYARERLRTIFRISSISADPALDQHLAARGYRHVDPTEVLARPLEAADATPGNSAILIRPLGTWLDAYAQLTGLPADVRPQHQALLRRIPLPVCHAIIGDLGRPLACGLAVLEGDLLGLFDVVTEPAARGLGHGTALVRGLLDWGRARGARTAYLQMLASNLPAAALYRKLGFAPLYHYWYRVSG